MSESSNAEKIEEVFFYYFKLASTNLNWKALLYPLSLTMVLRAFREAGVRHSGSEYSPVSGVEPGGGSREGGFDWLSHHTIQVP